MGISISDLWPTTLTYNSSLAKVKVNWHQNKGHRSNGLAGRVLTDRQPDGTDSIISTADAGRNNKCVKLTFPWWLKCFPLFSQVLQELTRRRQLQEVIRWDFLSLDTTGSGRLSAYQTLLLFRNTLGEDFSLQTWHDFLNTRKNPQVWHTVKSPVKQPHCFTDSLW